MKKRNTETGQAAAKILVHGTYTLVFVALAVTGALLYFPDLRLLLIGGYSLLIIKIHFYAGVAAVPLLAAFVLPLLKGRSDPARWKRAHSTFVLASGTLFILTGFVLWCITNKQMDLVEVSLRIHQILTVVAMGFVCVHLLFLRGAPHA